MTPDILVDMKKEVQQHRLLSNIQVTLSQMFFWVAVIASATASINAGADWFQGPWAAVIAALPALVLVIENTFKYEARSRWHRAKARTIEALWRESAYTGNQVEVAKKLSVIEAKFDVDKPTLSSDRISSEKGDK
jgi:hypothetical protein